MGGRSGGKALPRTTTTRANTARRSGGQLAQFRTPKKKGRRAAGSPMETVDRRVRQEKQAAFLAAFLDVATVTGAARAADVGRRTHYDWLDADGEYAAAFRDASEAATDTLEQEARRRAVDGIDKPVFYQGKTCGVIREYSDTLLIFLLKGRRPDVFRERFEHSGPGGGPIQSRVTMYLPNNDRASD